MNYRTIISFGEKNVDFLMNKFETLLLIPNKMGVRNSHLAGFFFGYSQGIRFWFIAVVFYIASLFIFNYNENPEHTYIAVYVLFVAALGSGLAMSNAPDVGRAKDSGAKIFSIIDEKS